jgi:hypothetical protein
VVQGLAPRLKKELLSQPAVARSPIKCAKKKKNRKKKKVLVLLNTHVRVDVRTSFGRGKAQLALFSMMFVTRFGHPPTSILIREM